MATVLSLPKSQSEGLPKVAEQCAALRGTFLRLSAEDEAAFQSVMESLRLPRNAPSRATELESAIQRAAEVPLDLCQACIELLSILEPLVDLSSRHAVSDVGVAAHLALAALRSSRLNVEINLTFMTDREAAMRIEAISRQVEEEGSERCQRIQEGVLHRIRE
jgi:formiminotetrahydrofolate cyclodeaminase